MPENILRELEDEKFFITSVGAHFRNTEDYGNLLSCAVDVDEARLSWAHTEYVQGVNEFSIKLTSGDPDHYKRCGALLRALYKIRPIVGVQFDPEIDDLDHLFAPVGNSRADVEHVRSLGAFFHLFANEMQAFSYTYNVCATFEREPTQISDEYIHTVCAYLKGNDNLSADSFYMMFKSLMLA